MNYLLLSSGICQLIVLILLLHQINNLKKMEKLSQEVQKDLDDMREIINRLSFS